MKQVIVIHGGTTFKDYESYITALRTKNIHPERMTYAKNWKDTLQADLGDDYQVLLPSMPNKTNAQYSEWKIWFDRIGEIATDGCILIGHSLGGVFLAKYLSENTFPAEIDATILLAAPYDDESIEDLGDFKIDTIADSFRLQSGIVTCINGTDDPAIPVTEQASYRAQLPDARYITLSAPDHFVRAAFPELVEIIKSL
ncbi:MAG: hypothetical protein EOO17_01525 [Chloroflexi bacterium]|nr:MAG: hypothetical protein EOO17_01525 [Chloroflexota bacterium]